MCIIQDDMGENQIKRFKKIRNLAVQCLKQIDIKRLDLVSLQLVQALRYEEIRDQYFDCDSPLKDHLIDMAVKNE